TFAAMQRGFPIVAQAVLRNPERRTYGAVDLLIRSDYLNILVPGTLTAEEAAIGAPALGTTGAAVLAASGAPALDASGAPALAESHAAAPPWHYRAVDVKFHTFGLMKDGHAGGGNDFLPYHV